MQFVPALRGLQLQSARDFCRTLCATLMSMTLVGHPCTTLSQANLLYLNIAQQVVKHLFWDLWGPLLWCYIWSRLPPTRPPEWVGSPRNTPLPCILLVFGASWHIHPCNAHTKVKFPTYDRFLHTHTYIYIYTYISTIYIIPYIPLINHLAISYACILPIYYLHAIYLLSMRFLHKPTYFRNTI